MVVKGEGYFLLELVKNFGKKLIISRIESEIRINGLIEICTFTEGFRRRLDFTITVKKINS